MRVIAESLVALVFTALLTIVASRCSKRAAAAIRAKPSTAPGG